ncbi:murein DD-endopeptidase MepM/ murein hydrolase activator NlpD [Friedmanniella endophytica]|uniref:Murein DD-endopeptidase MepM/ murein hydrolase activator NlpD n=1 Tax=Microlunatus kandeliicorticis TaxID=1759536 RepID=A0A7W3IUZ8_9ACTN|nr:M23 family metallopeptidase [Microlunatus kandeliicorticis]MBA8795753.1 murein DD-endopeptidase MepM/ murein hydrolase activator NlpD [Microlunatus kandeliicorticis]
MGRALAGGWRLLLGTGLALALAVVPAVALLTPAHADSLDDQKKRLDRQLSAQKDDLDGSSQQLVRAVAALRNAEATLRQARSMLAGTRTKLTAARQADRTAAAKLATQQRALAAARAKVEQGTADLDAQRRLTAQAVSEQYQKQTTLMPYALLVQSSSLAEFQSRVQMSATLLDASQVEFDRLTVLQHRLETDQAAQAELERRVAADRAAAARALRTSQDLERRAAEQAASVAALVGSRQRAADAAGRAVAQDKRDYAALQAENASVARRIAARIAREKAARASSAAAAPPAADASSHHGFVYPVAGPITSGYGMRFHPVLHVWKLHDGTDFGAGCGAPIRAAYSGRVVERYFNVGYGNRLMIDHGRVDGRYVTTGYNHAIRYVVGVGQRVRQGQLIGYVGQTGFSTGCHLHLMVWLDGSMVNPMSWY